MLKKIRSNFILKKIFDYMNKKRKFQSIVHNKIVQKKLGLNLIDFRRISGRYKVVKDGKIKEYNSYNNKLIFEGQFKWKKKWRRKRI